MITESTAEITQDYIDFCLALSREKGVRDYDSGMIEAERRGRILGAAEQRAADEAKMEAQKAEFEVRTAELRAADQAEIARLTEEIRHLRENVSERQA